MSYSAEIWLDNKFSKYYWNLIRNVSKVWTFYSIRVWEGLFSKHSSVSLLLWRTHRLFSFFSAHYICYRLDTLIYTRTEDHVLSTSTWRFWRIINKPSLLWCFCLKKSNVKWLHIWVSPFFCEDQNRQEVLSAFFLSLRLKCDSSGCSDQVLSNEDCI